MTFLKYALAAAAAGLLAAQPCAAASNPRAWDERRISAFAGVNLRMPLGEAGARPSARLQLTTSYDARDARTGSVRSFRMQGLELGAGRSGSPSLYMNGRTSAQVREQLRLSGSTGDTVWIVFGVTLVAVAVLVLSNSAELPGPPV